MLAGVRTFFAQRQVMEVDTPVLAAHTVTDPHLRSLVVSDGGARIGYLQTSPEFMMKRLLAAGSGSIYQIAKAFRAGELGRHHHIEFVLVEWYRLGFSMFDLMDEVVDLIHEFVGKKPVRRVAYADLFSEAFSQDPLRSDLALWRELVREHIPSVVHVPEDQDGCLDMLLSQVIVPTWSQETITCVCHYPASQAALARLCAEDVRVAERFEVYVGTVELANGYHELTDVHEQVERMREDNQVRGQMGLDEVVIDQDFLAALASGLPDCSGVALGFDRLFMLHLGKESLAEVVAFGGGD